MKIFSETNLSAKEQLAGKLKHWTELQDYISELLEEDLTEDEVREKIHTKIEDMYTERSFLFWRRGKLSKPAEEINLETERMMTTYRTKKGLSGENVEETRNNVRNLEISMDAIVSAVKPKLDKLKELGEKLFGRISKIDLNASPIEIPTNALEDVEKYGQDFIIVMSELNNFSSLKKEDTDTVDFSKYALIRLAAYNEKYKELTGSTENYTPDLYLEFRKYVLEQYQSNQVQMALITSMIKDEELLTKFTDNGIDSARLETISKTLEKLQIRMPRLKGEHNPPEIEAILNMTQNSDDLKRKVDELKSRVEIKKVQVLTNIKEVIEELKKLNPDAEIELVDEDTYVGSIRRLKLSVPAEELALPYGFEYNEKNGITNKHHTDDGSYISLQCMTPEEIEDLDEEPIEIVEEEEDEDLDLDPIPKKTFRDRLKEKFPFFTRKDKGKKKEKKKKGSEKSVELSEKELEELIKKYRRDVQKYNDLQEQLRMQYVAVKVGFSNIGEGGETHLSYREIYDSLQSGSFESSFTEISTAALLAKDYKAELDSLEFDILSARQDYLTSTGKSIDTVEGIKELTLRPRESILGETSLLEFMKIHDSYCIVAERRLTEVKAAINAGDPNKDKLEEEKAKLEKYIASENSLIIRAATEACQKDRTLKIETVLSQREANRATIKEEVEKEFGPMITPPSEEERKQQVRDALARCGIDVERFEREIALPYVIYEDEERLIKENLQLIKDEIGADDLVYNTESYQIIFDPKLKEVIKYLKEEGLMETPLAVKIFTEYNKYHSMTMDEFKEAVQELKVSSSKTDEEILQDILNSVKINYLSLDNLKIKNDKKYIDILINADKNIIQKNLKYLAGTYQTILITYYRNACLLLCTPELDKKVNFLLKLSPDIREEIKKQEGQVTQALFANYNEHYEESFDEFRHRIREKYQKKTTGETIKNYISNELESMGIIDWETFEMANQEPGVLEQLLKGNLDTIKHNFDVIKAHRFEKLLSYENSCLVLIDANFEEKFSRLVERISMEDRFETKIAGKYGSLNDFMISVFANYNQDILKLSVDDFAQKVNDLVTEIVKEPLVEPNNEVFDLFRELFPYTLVPTIMSDEEKTQLMSRLQYIKEQTKDFTERDITEKLFSDIFAAYRNYIEMSEKEFKSIIDKKIEEYRKSLEHDSKKEEEEKFAQEVIMELESIFTKKVNIPKDKIMTNPEFAQAIKRRVEYIKEKTKDIDLGEFTMDELFGNMFEVEYPSLTDEEFFGEIDQIVNSLTNKVEEDIEDPTLEGEVVRSGKILMGGLRFVPDEPQNATVKTNIVVENVPMLDVEIYKNGVRVQLLQQVKEQLGKLQVKVALVGKNKDGKTWSRKQPTDKQIVDVDKPVDLVTKDDFDPEKYALYVESSYQTEDGVEQHKGIKPLR